MHSSFITFLLQSEFWVRKEAWGKPGWLPGAFLRRSWLGNTLHVEVLRNLFSWDTEIVKDYKIVSQRNRSGSQVFSVPNSNAVCKAQQWTLPNAACPFWWAVAWRSQSLQMLRLPSEISKWQERFILRKSQMPAPVAFFLLFHMGMVFIFTFRTVPFK